MSDVSVIFEFADKRLTECKIERRSFEIWLSSLRPLNLITYLLPAILSAFAGGAIISDTEIFGDSATIIAAVAAFASSLLTIIHEKLNCAAHQAECNRIARAYRALEAGYQNLRISDPSNLLNHIEALNKRYEQLQESVDARVPDSCKKKAMSEQIQ